MFNYTQTWLFPYIVILQSALAWWTKPLWTERKTPLISLSRLLVKWQATWKCEGVFFLDLSGFPNTNLTNKYYWLYQFSRKSTCARKGHHWARRSAGWFFCGFHDESFAHGNVVQKLTGFRAFEIRIKRITGLIFSIFSGWEIRI